MATPLLDFSHLTPEQLWESLDPAVIGPSAADTDLLRARRAELATDDEPGEPWRSTIQELKKRGA